MEQRLESKFQEIITELHGSGSIVDDGDFTQTQVHEHRDACLHGDKAYTVDQGPGGITVFMPWRLHKPLQDIFNTLAPRGLLHVSAFDQLVDDAEIFPKFQSKRKRDDIMHYIYRRTATVTNQDTSSTVEVQGQNEDAKEYSGLLDFEAFLHTLFLLAKYRAAMLKSTQQCSFNQVVFRLVSLKVGSPKAASSSFAKSRFLTSTKSHQYGDSTPCRLVESSAGVPTSDYTSGGGGGSGDTEQTQDSKSDSDNDGLDNIPISKGATLKFDEQLAAAAATTTTQSFKDSIHAAESSTSIEPGLGRSNTVKASNVAIVNKAVDVGTTPLTGAASFDKIKQGNDLSNEKYESIMQELLHLQLEVSKKEQLHDELIKANGEIHKCNQELQLVRAELQNKIDELSQMSSEKDRMQEALQGEINTLTSELENLQGHLHLKHEVQKLTTLQAHHEAKLFSIFLLYRQPQLHLGEFYMSERDCAHFCVDFDLWQNVEMEDGVQVPMGKVAYQKVAEEAIDGCIFYWLFKAYLLEMAQMLAPELEPSLSFSQMLLEDIFPKCEGNDGGGATSHGNDHIHVQDGQVYIDDVTHFSPWDPASSNDHDANGVQNQPGQDEEQTSIQVQGKLWFQHPEEKQTNMQQYSTTPRFPYLG